MNDSPGWATPGSSPSDGERQGAPADQPATGDPKWSAQQPPPGQWSSPAAGQGAPPAPPQQPQPGQGWGSYGQQQGGQYSGPYGYPGGPGPWGKPPAAKPGVIPLRPLGLGEILDGAVSTMRSHWRSVLPITLVVATVVQVISILVQKLLLADLAVSISETPTPEELVNGLGSGLSITVATKLIEFLGTVVVTAMLTMIFSRAILGQGSTVSEAWRDARPQLLRLIGLTLLLGIGLSLLGAVLLLPPILGGSVGLALVGGLAWMVLAVWLWIAFSLASPVLMLEKSGIFTAFGRSWKLVKGSWWRIFGITALTVLIVFFVSMIIVMPLTLIGVLASGTGMTGLTDGSAGTTWGALIFSAVGLIIAQTITMPMQSGVTVLLYVDQRIRREALDLELARAAGVENYGHGATGG
ncbi:glycerophosphoryl diester phosphodiesterase membrane domain-containing protein [Streptomyces sp. NPDC058701]|uniref:glycerophosphoryl diester phosphodiesterase membrane domain-containing protein n=1 Tax=Streptomyces sp. NPDC058701 TaxID=3346608 RepID=UPI00364D4463